MPLRRIRWPPPKKAPRGGARHPHMPAARAVQGVGPAVTKAGRTAKRFAEAVGSMKRERENQRVSREEAAARLLAGQAESYLARGSLANLREAEIRAFKLLEMGADDAAVAVYSKIIAAYSKKGYINEAMKIQAALQAHEQEKQMREQAGH